MASPGGLGPFDDPGSIMPHPPEPVDGPDEPFDTGGIGVSIGVEAGGNTIPSRCKPYGAPANGAPGGIVWR